MKYLSIIIIFCVLLFSNCFDTTSSKDTPLKKASENTFIVQGQKIAALTFATLSSNLQKAMKEGGVSNAVKYCNIAFQTSNLLTPDSSLLTPK